MFFGRLLSCDEFLGDVFWAHLFGLDVLATYRSEAQAWPRLVSSAWVRRVLVPFHDYTRPPSMTRPAPVP